MTIQKKIVSMLDPYYIDFNELAIIQYSHVSTQQVYLEPSWRDTWEIGIGYLNAREA